MTNKIKLELMSQPENVSLARVTIATFAAVIDLPVSVLDEIKVAVSEAVSNAIIHGYQHDPSGVVNITATINDDQQLVITVEDQGVGIANLEKAMQPGSSSDPERMGLGFVFMKSFMDSLEVWTEVGKGTRVKLTKDLTKLTVREH